MSASNITPTKWAIDFLVGTPLFWTFSSVVWLNTFKRIVEFILQPLNEEANVQQKPFIDDQTRFFPLATGTFIKLPSRVSLYRSFVFT